MKPPGVARKARHGGRREGARVGSAISEPPDADIGEVAWTPAARKESAAMAPHVPRARPIDHATTSDRIGVVPNRPPS